jgi:hypothetical protein
MGEAGRARFMAEFEFKPFYRRLLSLYAEVAGTSRTGRSKYSAQELPK